MLSSSGWGTAEADIGLETFFNALAGSEALPFAGPVREVAAFAADTFPLVLVALLFIGMAMAPFPTRDLLEDAEEAVDLGAVLGANLPVFAGVAMSIRPLAAS